MEDILAIILIFGGGTAIGLAFSPVGRALAERIRGGAQVGATDPVVFEELEQMRQEMAELNERVDFTERLLSKAREAGQLGAGSE
ncbi:MAG TPA: hypothetical protein VJN95_11710 [Gemmatimonadales bacterium]|nr:hypothetical protein [Gemmatimonadales bacterium]